MTYHWLMHFPSSASPVTVAGLHKGRHIRGAVSANYGRGHTKHDTPQSHRGQTVSGPSRTAPVTIAELGQDRHIRGAVSANYCTSHTNMTAH